MPPNAGNKSLNRSLHAAKATKQDEFYTQLSDIEKELRHYAAHFKGKTVLCNCDDPRVSNFFRYFLNNFEKLGLKKLITTCYKSERADLFSKNDSERGIYFEYSGEQKAKRLPDPTEIQPREFKADGDFRSEECVNLLKRSDIVVTNPPFSLFREYVVRLVENKKKFVILANQNTLSTKDVFELVRDDKLWLGYNNGDMAFRVPDHYEPRETRFWLDEQGNKWRSNERHLNIRAFSENNKREAYERQKGLCIKCGKHFELEEMEADHATPWHEGGKTIAANCQMLCKDDNRRKSGK